MNKNLLVCLALSALMTACSSSPKDKNVATSSHPALSPSGQFILKIEGGLDGSVHFENFKILMKDQDNAEHVVFVSPDHYRTQDTLYFLWDDANRVWVYSGDVGTFYWTRIDDSHWGKSAYADGKTEAPQFLKSVRPQFFQK